MKIVMKNAFVSFVVAILALCSCSIVSDMPSGTPVQFDSFKGEVLEMSPMKYPARQVSYGYSVELRNDSAIVYLPYMGEVYNPVIGDEGLNFGMPYKDFRAVSNKKGTAKIATFSVSRGVISYYFRLDAYDSGVFTLHVQPSNAQGCTYSGRFEK